jgi:hypothetical protein
VGSCSRITRISNKYILLFVQILWGHVLALQEYPTSISFCSFRSCGVMFSHYKNIQQVYPSVRTDHVGSCSSITRISNKYILLFVQILWVHVLAIQEYPTSISFCSYRFCGVMFSHYNNIQQVYPSVRTDHVGSCSSITSISFCKI